MTYVIKRDGTREPFIYEKIVVSVLKAGANKEAARKIAKIIEEELAKANIREIATRDLRKRVLELLKKENEDWYKNWISYDREIKYI